MNKFYLSTIDPNAPALARRYGLGLEIAQYCTAWNMDEKFPETDAEVHTMLTGISRCVLHAPFNELFPCAIDPKARVLASERYRQAIALAKRYGATKVVIHGGFHPKIYYPIWYTEQSVIFWQEFLKDDPEVTLVLENVLEEDPAWLCDIVQGVNDPRLKLCLDIGHVNAYSPISAMQWLERCAPFLSHFHIHNNDGSCDSHSPLLDGTIPMGEFLHTARTLCPDATFTLELIDASTSLEILPDLIG